MAQTARALREPAKGSSGEFKLSSIACHTACGIETPGTHATCRAATQRGRGHRRTRRAGIGHWQLRVRCAVAAVCVASGQCLCTRTGGCTPRRTGAVSTARALLACRAPQGCLGGQVLLGLSVRLTLTYAIAPRRGAQLRYLKGVSHAVPRSRASRVRSGNPQVLAVKCGIYDRIRWIIGRDRRFSSWIWKLLRAVPWACNI